MFYVKSPDDKLPDIEINTDDWRIEIVALLKRKGINCKYNADDKSTPADQKILHKIMTKPVLAWTVAEMGCLYPSLEILKDEQLIKDLLESNSNDWTFDGNLLSLNYIQAKIIKEYPHEVMAWLPVVMKKHIFPNANNLQSVLNGYI